MGLKLPGVRLIRPVSHTYSAHTAFLPRFPLFFPHPDAIFRCIEPLLDGGLLVLSLAHTIPESWRRLKTAIGRSLGRSFCWMCLRDKHLFFLLSGSRIIRERVVRLYCPEMYVRARIPRAFVLRGARPTGLSITHVENKCRTSLPAGTNLGERETQQKSQCASRA